MRQIFICMKPAAEVDMEKAEEQMEKTSAFLNGLEPKEGSSGVHAPGQNLERIRKRNMERGIPVTEETWQKILDAAK